MHGEGGMSAAHENHPPVKGEGRIAEGRPGWELAAAGAAQRGEGAPTPRIKSGAFTIVMLTVPATHGCPLRDRLGSDRMTPEAG